jgi:aminoglycoside phosphotransferase family enzyme/predicted kinase
MPEPPRPALIEGLLRPGAYGHPAADIQWAETHISWVLLAGDFAYKIKKPVDFGFLDFSTLERRRFFCQEELRLNRRHARDLYLAVVPIADHPPRLDGSGIPVEYAVRMRRFDEANRFERLAESGRLLPEHLDALAASLAAFHAAIHRSTAEDAHGLPERQRLAAEFNFAKLRPLLDDPATLADLDSLHDWTRAEYARREPLLWQRKREGFVREGHGDLHLGNIVLFDGRPTLFDAIEFSENLRWIDTLSELAFTVMDLEARGAAALAYRLLNRYLEIVGDYAGLPLFHYYRLYRALVRAKIALLTRQQAGDAGQRAALSARCLEYISYGLRLIRPQRPRLWITCGVSGSGKSALSARLAERLPAIRLRSDVERKRLAPAEARSGGTLGAGLYTAAATERTYRRLVDLAGTLLDAGHSVVVDATFLKREQREAQRQVAEDCGAEFLILDCRAPLEVLQARVQARALAGTDASEADLAVLARQLGQREPLGGDEPALRVDTGREPAEALAAAIAAGLPD